ncbi:hypothetical protein GOODEAATRI_012195 [Goodea atripinnis]|uniref:Uncharacterized protein n=1 Tax=Goodea atripinnis TaxID=208336 RepID=A0ABV0PNE4_9TELE
MAVDDVGDVKESTMHQPLLSPENPLVVVVLQCEQLCLVNTDPWTTMLQLIDWDESVPGFYVHTQFWPFSFLFILLSGYPECWYVLRPERSLPGFQQVPGFLIGKDGHSSGGDLLHIFKVSYHC